jgi:hypothetical protein
MIYIHTLKDLNPKSLEIEITPLVREIKRASPLPLVEEKMVENFSIYFVSKTDLDSMAYSLSLVAPAVESILELVNSGADLELINLHRAISVLNEMVEPLKKNIEYSTQLFDSQEALIKGMTPILNNLKSFRDIAQKKEADQAMSSVFELILRNDKNFTYNFLDIVNEGQLQRISNLVDAMNKGYFFHVKIEEYLKKEQAAEISKRFPQEVLDKVNSIATNIAEVKKGIERTYNSNFRMVNMAVVLFAYIKWLK